MTVRIALRLTLALMGFMALAQGAFAACANPAATAGDMTYSTSANVMVYCDGTNWVSMAGGVSLTVNTAGGGATPAGSSADVQFNSSGALAADTGNFTYASGLLKAPNLQTGNISATTITATGAGNFGTINSTGLGTMGSLLVAGGATITGQASITTISTSLIQVGNNGAACSASLKGAQRYNSVSNTIDYCSGSAWLSLGPSATVVPAFSVNKNGTNQTITASTDTKLTWSTKVFDTNTNFDLATNRFSPTIPGKYLITLTVGFTSSASGDWLTGLVYKNGAAVRTMTVAASAGTQNLRVITGAIVDMNGTTDYIEGYVTSNKTTINGATASTAMDGILISMAGGGSGGTANPAGSTADVQFNSSGALAADTGKFTYSSGLLSAPTISATALNSQYLSATAIYNPGTFSGNSVAVNSISSTAISATTISGSLVQIGSTGAACNSGLVGSMRYNAVSDTIQICNSGGWTSVASSTTGSGVTGGTANYGAIFSGATTLTTDTALYVDRTNHYLGVGTNNPLSSLHVSTSSIDLIRGITIEQNNNGLQTPMFTFRKSRAGAAIQNGDYLGVIFAQAFDGNSYITPAGIGYIVSGTVVSGSVPTDVVFSVGNLNSPGLFYERMRISSGGNVGISTSAPNTALDVNGEIRISSTSLTCSANITGGALRYVSGTGVQYCNGSSTWTSIGGGGATPAGTTGDIQFNSANALAADTGKFTYTSATGTVSTTGVSTTYISVTAALFNPVAGASVSGIGGNSIVSGSTAATVYSSGNIQLNGKVAIPGASPASGARLDVSGTIYSRAFNAGSSTSIDWSQSNIQYTTANCGAFTFTNMVDGGMYTLGVLGSTGTCSFSHSGLTVSLPPGHAAASGKSIYSFVRMGSNLFVTYITGY